MHVSQLVEDKDIRFVQLDQLDNKKSVEQPQKPRVALLDALRGIAAMGVAVYHFGWRIDWDNWGNLGVPVFFVLSGFVIAMSIGSRRITGAFAATFALRREVRLALPYWVSIVAFVVSAWITARIGFHPQQVTWPQALVHLVYLQGWLGFKPIQDVYWTLAYEIQFYLALLLLIWLLQSARATLPIVMTVTIAISLVYKQQIGAHGAFAGSAWYCFGLGAMAYWATVSRGRLFAATAVAVGVAGMVVHDSYAITAALTALLIYLAIDNNRGDLGSHPVLQFLGRISYSFYLTHAIFGWIVLGVARHFVPDWAALLVAVGASVFAAWIYYLWFEAPATAWSKRFTVKADRTPSTTWTPTTEVGDG